MRTAGAIVLALAVVFPAVAFAGASAAADASVMSCGRLIAFSAPTAAQPVGQVRLNEAGQERVFQVTGTGTVTPPNVAAIGTALNPVILQLQGTPGPDGALTNFSLTQVASCAPSASALPSTATSVTTATALPALVASVVGIALLAVLRFRLRRRSIPS